MRVSDDRMTRRHCLALLAGTAATGLAAELCLAENGNRLPRLAISVETLAGKNISDARAAYIVWIDAVSRQYGQSTAEVVPDVFIPSEEILRGIRQGTIDCYGITALEFAKVADLTDPGLVVLQDYVANGIDYVLLVHSKSRFKTVADLRGAQILSHLHCDTVLLDAWLGTVLAASNLPAAERFFGSISLRDKVNQVVLPVYFRSADGACLEQRSWETAVELNPQLGRDLRVLAVSPKVIPVAIGFRRSLDFARRKALIDSMLSFSNSVAGQQISGFYGAHGFVVRPAACMKETLEMVRQYERALAQQPGSKKGHS